MGVENEELVLTLLFLQLPECFCHFLSNIILFPTSIFKAVLLKVMISKEVKFIYQLL